MNYRLTIGLVVALAITAAVSAIIVTNDDPGVPDRVRIQREFWYTIDDNSINHVSIRTGAQEQTWVRDDDRRWFFDVIDGDPVDRARWGGVTLLLSGPQHVRELAGAAAHLDRYGLVSPDTVIRIGVAGGAGGVVVRLGDRTPDGGENYAQKDDDPGVYLIDATWSEALTKLVREPPHQTLWGADSVVEGFNVEHQGSEQTWALDDEGNWRFDSPEGDLIDEEAWESTLELLTGPRFRYEVEDAPESLAPYGLDEPVAVVTFLFRSESPVELRLGAQTPDGARQYAQIQDAESVILVASDWGAGLANLILDPPPIAPPAEDDEDAAEGEDGDAADTDANGEAADADSDDSA